MTVVKALQRLEEMGIRLYVRNGEIRGRGQSTREALPFLEEILDRQEEAKALLELWGEPCTPEEEQRVKQAFTQPGTFLIYDERDGQLRWIC
jgi:Mn-dependent DtxR family transcriptional regulator